MKRTTIKAFIGIVIVSMYFSAFAQNPVTYIPKDNPNGHTDTTFIVLDAKKQWRSYEVVLADQTFEKGYLLKGKKQGNIQRYFPNGVLLTFSQFENGRKNGVSFECDKGGSIIKEENYRLDTLDGEVRVFASSKGIRILKSLYHYKAGKPDGKQTEYNEMGKLASETNYINGKKNGVSKWYFGNGQVATEQAYIEDKIEGVYKSYNQTGMVIAEGRYINGRKMGTWIEYNDNGTIKSQGDYKDDVKSGVWKYFDVNGTLERTETL